MGIVSFQWGLVSMRRIEEHLSEAPPQGLIWLSLSVLDSYQNGMWASSLLIILAVCLAFRMAMSLLTSPSSPCLRCQPRQVGDPLGGQRKLYRYHGFSKKLNLDMATQSKSGTLMPC